MKSGIKNLTKSYGEHRSIEDVSLSMEEGENFGLARMGRVNRRPFGRC